MQVVLRLMRRILPEMQSRHLREISWVLAGQAGALLASLLTLKILTTVLAPSVYAQLNLLLVAIILPTWLFLSPLTQALIRWYAPQREKDELGGLIHTTLVGHTTITLIVSMIGLGFVLQGFAESFGIDKVGALLVIGVFFVESWCALALGMANAARRRGVVAGASAAAPWLRLIFMVIFMWIFGISLATVLTGYLCGSVGIMLYLLSDFINERRIAGPARFNPALCKAMLVYGMPFGVWSSFAWVQLYIDRYVVEFVLGQDVAGVYIATLQVALIAFTSLGGLLGQLLAPVVYQRAGEGSDPCRISHAKSLVRRTTMMFAVLGILLVALVSACGPWLMQRLTSSQYSHASMLVFSLLALGGLFSVLGQHWTMLMLAQKRSQAVLWTKVLPSMAGVPLTLVLSQSWGLTGAAAGFALTMAVFLVVVVAAEAMSGMSVIRLSK